MIQLTPQQQAFAYLIYLAKNFIKERENVNEKVYIDVELCEAEITVSSRRDLDTAAATHSFIGSTSNCSEFVRNFHTTFGCEGAGAGLQDRCLTTHFDKCVESETLTTDCGNKKSSDAVFADLARKFLNLQIDGDIRENLEYGAYRISLVPSNLELKREFQAQTKWVDKKMRNPTELIGYNNSNYLNLFNAAKIIELLEKEQSLVKAQSQHHYYSGSNKKLTVLAALILAVKNGMDEALDPTATMNNALQSNYDDSNGKQYLGSEAINYECNRLKAPFVAFGLFGYRTRKLINDINAGNLDEAFDKGNINEQEKFRARADQIAAEKYARFSN